MKNLINRTLDNEICTDHTYINLKNGINLLLRKPTEPYLYPSCKIQKGLIITHNADELVEEGVGLGLPLIMFGPKVVFPGEANFDAQHKGNSVVIKVKYHLNLIAYRSLKWGKVIKNRHFYKITDFFSKLHRQNPRLRDIMTWASYPMKVLYGMNTVFLVTEETSSVSAVYDINIDRGIINSSFDLTGLTADGLTEIIIANEQGANYFNSYRDSNGIVLHDKRIGTWDETFARSASLVDYLNGISFSINRVGEARIFRGRELMKNRLAWSGLNYVLPRHTTRFEFNIKIGVTS